MAHGVRERARDALRAELADALSKYFAERGFDEATVDEAAKEAGISRATFFRYFACKEDAVLAALEASSIDYGAVLESLPPIVGESPWDLMHRMFTESVANAREDSEPERSRLRMIHTTPSLRARLTQRYLTHERNIAPVLARRIERPEAAGPLIAAGLAGFDYAWRLWATGECPSIRIAVDRVFNDLADAGRTVDRAQLP